MKFEKINTCQMPVISYFYGIYIYMYYLDNKTHYVPHIHAIFGEEEAVYSILTGYRIEGFMHPKKEKLIQAWISIREYELLKNWDLAVKGIKIESIKPLI
jgi:hypothetical protein